MTIFYKSIAAAAAAFLLPAAAIASVPFGCWAPGDSNPYTPPMHCEATGGHLLRVDKLGNSKWDNTDGHDLREVSTEGTLRVLVVLVDFSDVKFSTGSDPRQTIDDMLNEPGFSKYGATGSAADFYRSVSFGQFSPQFDVYGPVQLSKREVEYVNTDEKYTDPDSGKEVAVYAPGRMVEETVKALDDVVDFSIYDSNSDGMVDFVYIFFPGRGATTGGNRETTIWPHAYTLTSAIGTTIEVDGVEVNRYATSSEIGNSGSLSGIGTFCHEFGHVLGLPDLYDTANNGTQSKCFTPGSFSTMDFGNNLNDEHTPPLFSAYETYALEWLRPIDITGGGRFTMLPLASRPMSYKIPSPTNPQEYFLFENRSRLGWDAWLDAQGLAVWHIDFDKRIWDNNTPNNEPTRQRIDLVEADAQLTKTSRDGDLFPGAAGVCEFLSNVSPTFLTWDNRSTGYEIEEIVRHPDGAVSFTVVSTSGHKMPGADLASPEPRLRGVGSDSFRLEWEAVEGAGSYALAVWAIGADQRDCTPLAEWQHRDLGNVTSVTVDGLDPATSYGVALYAAGDVTFSRQSSPLELTTLATDFAEASTRLYAWNDGDSLVRLEWDAVEGASNYLLTVATRHAGESVETWATAFDNSELPEGFTTTGMMETRASNAGASAPSLRLTGVDGMLQTPLFEREIKSIAMWARQRFADAECRLDFYDATTAQPRFLFSASDFTSKGEIVGFDIPSGVHALRIVHNQKATGLDLFVDDITVSLTDGPADTPVSGYDRCPVEGHSARISGLDANSEYVGYVVPVNAEGEGIRSQTIYFTPSALPSEVKGVACGEPSGARLFAVEGDCIVCADPELAFAVYAADGRCVAREAKGRATLPATGIFIVRAAGRSLKIVR